MNYFLFFMLSGIILIFIEIFVPGGIFGVIGSLLLLLSAVFCFNLHGTKIGFYYTFAMILFITILVVLALSFAKYFPFRNKIFLTTSEKDINIKNKSLESLMGQEGKSFTVLRPTGKIIIDNKRYDAMTEGTYIPKNVDIKIIRIENNRLIVRKS